MANMEAKLLAHAQTSTEFRQIANWAEQLATDLRKLNAGPVYDHERDSLIKDAVISYDKIKEFMEQFDG